MIEPGITPPDPSIPDADWEQTPASVRVYIAKLEEKTRRNSRNSSQPPSQDSLSQKPGREKDIRKPRSGRARGGQIGHSGTGRSWLPVEAVDDLIVCRPEVCTACGTDLVEMDGAPYRYQVTEIPVVKAQVVEYQVHTVNCPCCQAVNGGQLPSEVAAGQFGPRVVSLVAVLMGLYRLSKRQVVRLLSDCFGVQMAVSSVVNQQQAVSEALAAPMQAAQKYVQDQAACNVDETRWPQHGQAKTGWLWVVVTQVVTVFQIALSRSKDVAQHLLGTHYPGIVGSDRAGSYQWLDPAQRQVCWSHRLRDFQCILERGGPSFVIGTNLKLQGEYLLVLWVHGRDAPAQRAVFLAELPDIQRRVHHWLTEGATCTNPQTARTCANLLTLETALWTFAGQADVEPTNNRAERALRHPVIWRRLSSGTHSPQGSLFVERLLTTVESCRQQQRDPLEFIRQAVLAHRAGLPAPSLLPVPCDVVFVTP
jgi:transposase